MKDIFVDIEGWWRYKGERQLSMITNLLHHNGYEGITMEDVFDTLDASPYFKFHEFEPDALIFKSTNNDQMGRFAIVFPHRKVCVRCNRTLDIGKCIYTGSCKSCRKKELMVEGLA